MRHFKTLLFTTVALLSNLSRALPEDSQKPISIQSDKAAFDRGSGITTYSGNVIMVQGSMKIHADTVQIFSSENKATQVTAAGNPGQFQQIPRIGDLPVVATAKTMEYDIDKKILTLTENAKLEQNGAHISGPEIIYDVDAALVNAGKSDANTSNERVKMIIPPQQGN